MPIRVAPTHPGDALAALGDAVRGLQAGNPLAAVTVVVPTNATGVTARRWLGRNGGIAAVDMLTLYRLAELLGGPALAAAGRMPVSTPVIDLTVRAVLAERPGPFEAVAEHPSTVVALRDLHRELRLAGPAAPGLLANASERGRAAASISALVAAKLVARWYDEADLLATSIGAAGRGSLPPTLRRIVVFLPHPLRGLDAQLVGALGEAADVTVLAAATGDARLDADLFTSLPFGDTSITAAARSASVVDAANVSVASTTDADEEVRHAVRAVWSAARDGVAFSRMAVLWPADRPYARLVEHHLELAEIPWNGRPGTGVAERIVPRFLLDLLDVDRRGLRRRDMFDLIADLPVRTSSGAPVPVARWERVSRDAGVTGDADWAPRLGSYAARQRRRAEQAGRDTSPRADDAEQLAAFVADLRTDIGRQSARRTWRQWADWSDRQIVNRLGTRFLRRLAEPEQVAWEHTNRVLDRLRCLDELGGPVPRSEFRAVFAAEFDVAPGRLGRIGRGVTIGSLSGAVGLDVDLAITLGAADGLMPPAPSSGPLVSDADRRAAGLAPSDAVGLRLERQFRSVLAAASRTIVTMPRGDLRATATRHPSRWLASVLPEHIVEPISSHHAALLATPFPAHAGEHRLRRHLAHVVADGPLAASTSADALDDAPDDALDRALTARAARRSDTITVFDGDLSGVPIDHFARPIAPTNLELWMACPHAYFVRHVLGVNPVEEPGDLFEISAADRGNLIHAALDRFHREVIDGQLPQPGPPGWLNLHWVRLAALFDEVADEYEATGRTGRAAAWRVDRRNLLADLHQWFAHDSHRLQATGATVVRSEERFGADSGVRLPIGNGRTVAVHGQIDRIDRAANGELIVVDHKTGSARDFATITADDPTAGGTKFQLPAYAAGALAIVGEPAPVRAEYSFFARERYTRIGYAVNDDVWRRVEADLDHVVSGVEAGFFPAVPDAPGFQFYIACHYCQPDGLGTAERYSEWLRKHHDPRVERWFGDVEPDEPVTADTPGVPA